MFALRRLGSLRTAIALFTVITAVQTVLIVIGNITDYETNHQFVTHVLGMDTTFKSPNMMWRSITSPTLVTIAYVLIIAWEAVSAGFLVASCVAWLRNPEKARRLAVIGWLMWVALFGGAFIAIGGEWFQMWQSSKWNGLHAALQNLSIAAIALLLAFLPKEKETETA